MTGVKEVHQEKNTHSVQDSQLLFYDIEVFTHDAFVVFKDIDKNEIAVFHNEFTGINEVIRNKVLVGYNNHFYDDKILNLMQTNVPVPAIKRANDDLIGNRRKLSTIDQLTIDCFQQVHVSRPSLKRVEGNAGKMILESEIDFNIDRPLTQDEYQESLNYCRYDVDTTIDIYKKRKSSYFLPKWSLLDQMNGFGQHKWNTTTLSANMLTQGSKLKDWHIFKLDKNANSKNGEYNQRLLSLVPEPVQDLWLTKDKGSVTVEDFGCSIEFGFGGLHGVSKKHKENEDVKLLDVALTKWRN